MPWTLSVGASEPRDPKFKSTDASALKAIAQAAINVELFTIPLYMGSLYSLKGMHQITGKGESFYKGRLWPGAAASAQPKSGNERAFNIIFSVFIQEMLHLQMAANIAGAIGVSPNFTSAVLQNDNHGWTCFGPDKTFIPHIVDLRDLDAPYTDLKVDIAALSKEQVRLFLVIEQPDAEARRHIVKGKYFPTVPFAGWEFYNTEQNLPLFGTIGYMYQCYYDYLNIKYKDGTSLWQYVTVSSNQRDLFNVITASHPEREYPHFAASLSSLNVVVDMMDAITDQGEGSTLVKSRLAAAVEERYRSSEQALKADYPSYTDSGAPAPSAGAAARYANDGKNHFERFQEVQALLDAREIETWADWFAAGNTWKKEDLQAPDYQPRSIVQVHLAGGTHCGTHVIDTHNQPVPNYVWPLYGLVQQRTGGVATLLEWDADIPPFGELVAELARQSLQVGDCVKAVVEGADMDVIDVDSKAGAVRAGRFPRPAAARHLRGEVLSTPIDFHLGRPDA